MNKAQKISIVILSILGLILVVNQILNNFNFVL